MFGHHITKELTKCSLQFIMFEIYAYYERNLSSSKLCYWKKRLGGCDALFVTWQGTNGAVSIFSSPYHISTWCHDR